MSSVIVVKRGYRRAVIAAGMRGAPGAGGGGSAGVSSFNTRTGPVTLVSADVSGALGYTPANSADLADVALSGAYADLLGLPAIPATPGDVGAATAAQGAKADTAVQPGELASVAASGSYADLSAKPFIPALPGDIGAATAAQGGKADTAVQPAALASGLAGKVDVDGDKVLSDENYTAAEKAKLAGIEAAHFKGLHASLAALQSAHPSAAAGDYADVDSGVGADVARYIWDVSDSVWLIQSGASGSMTAAQIKTAYESNPDTNGFSDAEKSKLGAIAPGATANATDAQLRDRSTHAGTQAASTISDLAAAVRGVIMTGVSFATATAGLATDSLLVFLGKLQAQVNSLVTTVAGKQDTLVSGTTIKTVNGSTLLGAGDLVVTGGASLPVIRAITGNETLGISNVNTFGVNATTSNYTSTIPAQATVAWTADAELHFLPSNTGDITIAAAAGVSLNGVVAGSAVLSTQNGAASIKRLAADSWWIGGIVDGGAGGAVDSVNGQTGVVVLDADDIAEGATNHYYPQADETKLAGISAGATANSADAFLLARGNHTGTQTSSTISDFASASRAQTEAELVAGTNITITPSGTGATRQLTIASTGGGGGASLASFRGKLMNADFRVNQRGYVSGTGVGYANTYTIDRWRVVTAGQSLSFSASGNGYQITAPAGGVEQVIEGVNIEGGTYVLDWTGTATAKVNGTARTSGETFTLTANTNVTVRFTGGTVSLAQLERGSSVTAFEHRPYGLELALCQRYYWRGLPRGGHLFGSHANGVFSSTPVSLPVTMRATPTLASNFTGISYSSCGSASINAPTPNGFSFYVISTATASNASVDFAGGNYMEAISEL